MEHDQITDGINKGDIVIIYKGKKGGVGRIKFKDGGDVFNYDKDKPVSIKLKDHLKQVALHTSDGFKAHKKEMIDFIRTNFFAMTQRATGLVTRDFVLEELIKKNEF